MTSKAAHNLKDLLKDGGGGDGPPSKFLAHVAAVHENGDVDLKWGGKVVPEVPAGSGYPPWMRKAGDKVLVEVIDGGDWLVTTSAGTNEYPPGVTAPATASARLGWGADEPGPDWSAASAVFLRKATAGPELYAQTPPGAPENPLPESESAALTGPSDETTDETADESTETTDDANDEES